MRLEPSIAILGSLAHDGRKIECSMSLAHDGRGKGEGEFPPPSNSLPRGEGELFSVIVVIFYMIYMSLLLGSPDSAAGASFLTSEATASYCG